MNEAARVPSAEEARRIVAIARAHPHAVSACDQKEELRNPPPPLITSSLQQMAGMRHRYSPKKTMELAQQLYEGIGGKGLITYMRTDAVTLSPEFVGEARDWLKANAPEALAERAPRFRESADAQGAHEAIRPTSASLTPEDAARSLGLNRDQLNIYRLVWERAIASQCRPARIQRSRVVVACQETRWVARGSVILDPGYLRFWKNTEDEKLLPRLRSGQALSFLDVRSEEKQTQPPSRFSEPKLVQLMEKKGIGRPSTYASTLATLKDRDYVILEKGMLVPTPLGMATDDALARALPELVDTEFTARMESELDRIAEGKLAWERYLCEWNEEFFAPAIVKAREILGVKATVLRARAGKGEKGRKGGKASGARPAAKAPEAALAQARRAGAVPSCAGGHGELELRVSKKGGLYWKCPHSGCESWAWHQELAAEKCPSCGQRMEKVRTRKVVGGYFLKCARIAEHAGEVVLFRDRRTKRWDAPQERGPRAPSSETPRKL